MNILEYIAILKIYKKWIMVIGSKIEGYRVWI
jgi:hypothetical protein